MGEFGNPHRGRGATERVFNDNFRLRLAENQPNAWLIAGMFESVIDRRQVEIHLAGIFWFELPALQFFCGARRYVALGPFASDFRMAHGGKRHITGPSSSPIFSTLRDLCRLNCGGNTRWTDGAFGRYDNRVKADAIGLQTERVSEVALWCSFQSLTGFHEDSPDEARRRELMNQASQLLAKYHKVSSLRRHVPSWLQRYLPNERLWNRALQLIEAAAPDSLAPLEHQLRSSALKPSDSIGSIYSEERQHEIVKSVIDIRSSLIKLRLADERGTPPGELRGRLLLYVPSDNVSDGASRYASNGFFDPDDCPPWDSWLQYSERTLISWVPEVLFPLAQAGMDANAVDCIKWAD